MGSKPAIYDTSGSKELALDRLIDIFQSNGVVRVIYKNLSPNDNSKNQPYVGSHLTDLGFLPAGDIIESASRSVKTKDPKRKVKYTAPLNYAWLSAEGTKYPAPDAKLIYYPQYPEVRFSGFVNRCQFDMGGWMDPTKKGRMVGRVLFFGIKSDGEILAYLATPESRIAQETQECLSIALTGVFNEITLDNRLQSGSARDVLIQELRRIHQKQWIPGKRLDRTGLEKAYKAQNGGGYTLEAELGVKPNGIAEPDFMGWEIKQFGVKKCHLINSKPLTLMTPEPDGGLYVEQGFEAFIRKYGYTTKEDPGRYDFTGRHFIDDECDKSKMTLVTMGYDAESGSITDASGCIALLDVKGNPASTWSFAKIMGHWMRKHAKAAYIPSLSQTSADKIRSYHYCNNVRLFTGSSFINLLQALENKQVYYDPGINLKNANTKPESKRRSQFRIKSAHLECLYDKQDFVDILKKE